MEEYDYLDNMDNEALVKIVVDMIDFEETTKALMVLEDRDVKKALEIGKQIIKNNRGDDYLQATVWNILFYDNEWQMIEAVDIREKEIGKTLLDEIIIDLTNQKLDIKEEILIKINSRYLSLDSKEKENMCCNYEEFAKIYFG